MLLSALKTHPTPVISLSTTTLPHMEKEVTEVISRAAVSTQNFYLCILQETIGIVGSVVCAVQLVEAYRQKKGKKEYLKILAIFGLIEFAAIILPYVFNLITFYMGM